MGIKISELRSVLALEGEERRNLAAALQDETITTVEGLAEWLFQHAQVDITHTMNGGQRSCNGE